MGKKSKTKRIQFSIQQIATVNWTATAEVPASLDLDDLEAVSKYLEKNIDRVEWPDGYDDIDYDSKDFETVDGVSEITETKS
jgi:hypothetical protein